MRQVHIVHTASRQSANLLQTLFAIFVCRRIAVAPQLELPLEPCLESDY